MSTGGAGGTTPPGMSHLPVPPGGANMPEPTGAGTKITTVHWAGFKGAVSYSFDDDNQSQITNYAALNAVGVPLTFFLWTGKTEATNAIWKTAFQDGHEMANHTKSHNAAGTTGDITAASQFIMSTFGTPAWSMAAPNGDQSYPPLAKDLFFINRGVGGGLIAPNDSSNPFDLHTFIAAPGADASAYNSQVDGAISGNKWLTVCIHGFSGDASAYNAIPLASVVDSLKRAKTMGAWCDTITSVGSYWLGEKAFNAATSMTSGTDKTFTWKLPDHFPPGHYIRVTTDGGVLKQGGTALAWDPHGYYEVALDPLSVTLSSK